jgi:hypothetical protein
MPAITFMTDTTARSLPDLVATLRERVEGLRRAGDVDAYLAAASAAADEIENRVGDHWNDEGRQALTAVQRFTYNAAADGWPGWSVPDKPPDTRILMAARELAQRSSRLVKRLALGPLQEGTGTWLCAAIDLALGRYADASSAFAIAHQLYVAAKAPGLALLTEGYIAIVAQVAGHRATAGAPDLEQISARIAAGNFDDGAEFIEQLRTALKVFAR